MLIKLGNFKFSVGTLSYHSLKQHSSYRWIKQELFGAPLYQCLGAGENTLSLDGIIYPGQIGSLEGIEKLKKEAAKMMPLSITDSSGNSYGQWVILSITENYTSFDYQGHPFKLVFKVELAKYTKL